MTSLTRTLLPAAVAALAAALAMCVTGCQNANSTVVGAGLTSAAPSAPGAPAARAVPSQSISATHVPGSAQAVPPSAAGPAGGTAAPVVYLAEGGSVGGTVLRAPACRAGCQLSGDGTTSLWDMTWATWNSAVAVGAGTEKLDDCTPNCAAGTLHPVPVRVTLSRAAMVCVSGAGRWFWSRVSFTWPAGLPAAFSGGNAPLNPFDYPGITARAAKSCP